MSDPVVRRILARDRASARVRRRVVTMLDYVETHPEATRANSSAIRRLDDLLGEAGRLRNAL